MWLMQVLGGCCLLARSTGRTGAGGYVGDRSPSPGGQGRSHGILYKGEGGVCMRWAVCNTVVGTHTGHSHVLRRFRMRHERPARYSGAGERLVGASVAHGTGAHSAPWVESGAWWAHTEGGKAPCRQPPRCDQLMPFHTVLR